MHLSQAVHIQYNSRAQMLLVSHRRQKFRLRSMHLREGSPARFVDSKERPVSIMSLVTESLFLILFGTLA